MAPGLLAGDLLGGDLAAHLRSRRYGRSLEVSSETESTNDDARRAAERGAVDGHVLVADHQSRGRGSHGRAWSSPAGVDLYFSIVVRPPLAPKDLPPITLATGLAVANVIASLAPDHDVHVKWPNDVWLDSQKCAGILVESTTVAGRIEAAIIGVGLNVNRARFDGDLATSATSLHRATGHVFDRARVLGEVLTAIEHEIDTLVDEGPSQTVARLEPKLLFVGRRVRVEREEGTLLGLAPTGALRVALDDGSTREIIAGTIETL